MTNEIRTKVVEKITQQMREIGFIYSENKENSIIFSNSCAQKIEVPIIVVGD